MTARSGALPDTLPSALPSALPDALRPAFDAPHVQAVMSTRAGGVSQGAGHASLNLRHGVGDDQAAVDENLARFAAALGARPRWLRQVHGTRVVRLARPDADEGATAPEADAAITTEPGVACAVQVADCLPVLFAAGGASCHASGHASGDLSGDALRGVGAAHAGWRGLSAGVLEATLDALCAACACEPADVEAWLGPCIGTGHFEVGADVLAGFGVNFGVGVGVDPGDQAPGASARRFRPVAPGKWLADLPGLAHDRLVAAGVRRINGGQWCTVADAARFFSFRRDTRLHGSSGRMAAAIWFGPIGAGQLG